ncbi:MAG: PilZ domain-containing protein [Deltaproteobacteria bacterium]|nr:PilZ domain-containing protein [Deltaproteobacteria bacterium]
MEVQNRRQYIRTSIILPAKCQILEKDEIDLVRKGEGKSLFRDRGHVSPIDEMVEQATPGRERRAFLKEVVEISGSGMKFTSEEPLAVGTLLKTDLIMPGSARFRVELIAEVLRVEEVKAPEPARRDPYLVAAAFKEIDEDARDAIIKTVFDNQRKMIRLSRQEDEE